MTGAPALTVDTSSIRSALPAPAPSRQESPETFQEALKRSGARNAQAKRSGGAGDAQHGAPAIFHTATDLAVVELATPAQAKLAVAKAQSGQTAPGDTPKNDQSSTPKPTDAVSPEPGAERPAPASASRPAASSPGEPQKAQSGFSSSVRSQSEATAAPSAVEHAEKNNSRSDQQNQPGAGQDRRETSSPAAQSLATSAAPNPQTQAVPATGTTGVAPMATVESAPATEPSSGVAVGAIKPAGALQTADGTRAAKPSPAQDMQQERLQAQFGKGLAAALRQNGGTVTLRLKPEDLGDLKIRLQVQNGRVEARFEVATDEAHAAVGESLKHLRSALEAKGLEVTSLDVHTVERRDPASPGRDAPDSGPGFANHDHGAAGGDAGDHGRPGAESDRFGPARDLASGAAAEPEQERSPLPAWMSRRSEGISGGAPHNEPGLDAIA